MKPTLYFLSIFAFAFLTTTADVAELPIGGPVINIVEWDGGKFPPVFQRSDQLPLTQSEVLRLSQNDFTADQIAQMVEERRYVGDASADGLIALKTAGVPPQVIQAVSLHALPPNRALNLEIELVFEGTSREARRRYLYIIVPDGDIERIFTADLHSVLSGHWQRDVTTDNTDPLLPRRVRRVTFTSQIPLKSYGKKNIRVFTSTRPNLFTSADIPEADLPNIRSYTIDYPVSSLNNDCRIQVRYRQDTLLPYKWSMTGSHLQCDWN
ncbi:MAG: hypothetical protein O7G87_10270 [bacterium]|nr:hypothetical protein [bacterium]